MVATLITIAHDPCPLCGERWLTCSHMLVCGSAYRGAVLCRECGGDGEVASRKVDEDGDECPPVVCGRCGGTGVDPLRAVK